METEGYTVRLDSFEGPMDLLLYLIRRAEVDIHDIPIGAITEQFMAFLSEISRIDMDAAGEFLLMAATLMEIKSRSLSPAPAASEDESASKPKPEDPRQELVSQLLEYRRVRESASALEERFESWRGRLGGGGAMVGSEPTEDDPDAAVELDDLHVMDLVEAFNTIIEAVDFTRLGEHEILDDETPMELHAADIVDRLERMISENGSSETGSLENGSMPLAALFEGRRRVEMIGLFLATLELVRTRRVAVVQDDQGQIHLALREPEPIDDPDEPDVDELVDDQVGEVGVSAADES